METKVTEKIIEALKVSLENDEETTKALLTIKGQIDAMAHVQGMVVKSLALLDPRLQSYLLAHLKEPKNEMPEGSPGASTFDAYIAWARQVVSGDTDEQKEQPRPPWLKGVIDGGKPEE